MTPFERAAGGGVELPRDPAGAPGEASRFDGQLHRRRHRHRIVGARRCRSIRTPSTPSSMASVASERSRRRRRRLPARRELPDDPDARVLNPEAGADWRARGITAAAPALQLAARDRVVARVGEDDEALFHQPAVASTSAALSGKSVRSSPMPPASPTRTAPPRGRAALADRLVRRVAAGRVGQQHVAVGVDVLEDRLLRLVHGTARQLHARTATVTITAPEASCAATITSGEGYLPVPTMRREGNVRPAIVRGVSIGCFDSWCAASRPAPVTRAGLEAGAPCSLTAADEVDDFHLVACRDDGRGVGPS